MALLERKDGAAAVIEDRFTRVDDEAALPVGPVIVSLSRFQAEREALLARDADLGVWLDSDESPSEIAGDLGKLAVVACNFPAFNDGRGFSYARLLRERHGYEGEVRAIGEVMLEQAPFMARSGFSTFELGDVSDVAEFKAVIEEVRTVYQPTGDGRETALQRRLGR
ncbi:MAG: oxidoreductase [Deltaproteobacteria bacterium]|nr:oxidoreductase [Deltaproteobacteria bacterium]